MLTGSPASSFFLPPSEAMRTRRGSSAETPEISTKAENPEAYEDERKNPKSSDYERFREERIKENLERMQKLGIVDLSIKLKSLKPTPKRSPSDRKTPHQIRDVPLPGPVRRSSRLQNVTPISYSELRPKGRENLSGLQNDLLIEKGARPELYTEEHEKLLGSTEKTWTLFVDGYGKDGKRIYDPVNGKTCHQCRQKTLGHRTQCSKCNMVQGQFCGDCLYMRYGEHVLEVKQNPSWLCPVCRGICNCSLCRQGKGWPPTGPMYKKVSNLGFKSVAHYLIQTRRAVAVSENDSTSKIPVSARRSLPFSDMEEPSAEKEVFGGDQSRASSVPETEDLQCNEDGMESSDDKALSQICQAPELHPLSSSKHHHDYEPSNQTGIQVSTEPSVPIKVSSVPKFEDLACNEDIKQSSDEKTWAQICQIQLGPKMNKRRLCKHEPIPHNIAGQAQMEGGQNDGILEVTQSLASIITRKKAKMASNCTSSSSPDADSIAGRLKLRRRTMSTRDAFFIIKHNAAV